MSSKRLALSWESDIQFDGQQRRVARGLGCRW